MAGIYIHIPFCKTRCIYCDFYSTTQSELMGNYVESVCKELETRKDYLHGEPVTTIYFGGGTPSQIQKHHFEQIFKTIDNVYFNSQLSTLNSQLEITLEANPDDLTPDYLKDIASLPFNRISMGIQTFNDETLKLLKRRHTAGQAIEAVKNARTAGFHNISIDLIYGLPSESLENWRADLNTALQLDVQHISAYHLIYEEDTPLFAMLKNHTVNEVGEEDSNLFFAELIDTLTAAGYEHYEISNFCLPGKQSKHNSSYWDGSIYLGCGPSAHSFDGINRMWNVSSLTSYIKGMEQGTAISEQEILDDDTRYNDLIITSLRTSKGLDLELLEKEFGEEYLDYCLKMAQKHLNTNLLKHIGRYLCLTRQGIFVSDGIMSDLLRI
ncbi:radical SAM family heme chaperone HemW [Bacteroides sp. 519]|uniref:radical SAM family heme chaperone HemW n=1 Tax=Bacteroides sp. 519 TaxID=2302937 RepID=UPI0013D039A2|nr:radical SAM family heme chaperone HemW [Bacteroides sp. 519]NDV58654.1 radical SAM family heme chaperone HemW [Bacteroides sp. 519]